MRERAATEQLTKVMPHHAQLLVFLVLHDRGVAIVLGGGDGVVVSVLEGNVVVVVSKHGSSRQGVQAGAGEGTMMEPPSVKSKLMMEDEKICSSGLYVTNCARDSLQQQQPDI